MSYKDPEKRRASDQKYRDTHKEELQEYRDTHKKETQEYNQKYYQDHKEEIKEQKKQYYLDHKEERQEYCQQYYQDHKGEICERQQQHLKAHPEKNRANNRKRRALKKSQLGLWHHMEVQLEELMHRSQEGRCYYCGDILDWENRIESPLEHMTPLVRGGPHGILNWCIACQPCNQRKSTKTAEEFELAKM